MNKNKIVKRIAVLLIIFMTILNFNVKVFGGALDWEDRQEELDRMEELRDPTVRPGDYKPSNIGSEPELEKKVGVILGVINTIGVIVSVITLMIIGIKYMIGSVEEKAEYKKTMTTYIIGAILIFSITTISNMLYQIGIRLNDI